MTERSLLTLGDWHRAYLDGASPREWLDMRMAQLGQQDPVMWIPKASIEALQPQIAALGAPRRGRRALMASPSRA